MQNRMNPEKETFFDQVGNFLEGMWMIPSMTMPVFSMTPTWIHH